MHLTDGLAYSFGQIRDGVRDVVVGLDSAAAAWRPDAGANSIAWLVWHLARITDAQVCHIAGTEQQWHTGGWAERFGLDAGYDDTGYGHSAADVAAIRPADPSVLLDYHEVVADMTTGFLRELSAEDLDRVIDRSYDPPVTVGIRLMSINGDALQHLGQAAYLRGLLERR